MRKAVIFFTKVPIAGLVKTRLIGFLSVEEAALLQQQLIKDNYYALNQLDTDIFVFYTPDEHKTILFRLLDKIAKPIAYIEQDGADIGERMLNSLRHVKELGYQKIILIGSDLVNLTKQKLAKALLELDEHDIVIGPTYDGGYGLIGLRSDCIYPKLFSLDNYSTSSVYSALKAKIEQLNLKLYELNKLRDIDVKEDIFKFVLKVNRLKFLAAGEYNINYVFTKNKKRQIFRINTKSQMQLTNQIEYEFNALKLLEQSTVTPQAYQLFAKSMWLPNGAMTMQYVEGRQLDYTQDLKIAADLLAKIHQVKVPSNHHLTVAHRPFQAMYDECVNMSNVYLNSNLKQPYICDFLIYLRQLVYDLGIEEEAQQDLCIINTELNSSNFIIGKEQSYIIDWEKPIFGEKEQDLAHFLAPTTTFWKTDFLFNQQGIDNFLNDYAKYGNLDFDKVNKYLKFNCFRGIAWCAMAYTEYLAEKELKHDFTFNKIVKYLTPEFLSYLDEHFLKRNTK